MDSCKYLTKRDVIQANNAAIREKRNRKLPKEFVDTLPDDGLFFVSYYDYHHKDEIRVEILFDYRGDGVRGLLDMSILRFNALPVATRRNDGSVLLEENAITDSKRPYPKRREWQEAVVRKPVRKQYKFRKQVLEAYENQCAVCNIKNPSLLRAAHIIPAVKDDDDCITNGICLCVLHEVAFDRGILQISPDGKVMVRGNENIKVDFYHIRLPLMKENHPSTDKLDKRFKETTIKP